MMLQNTNIRRTELDGAGKQSGSKITHTSVPVHKKAKINTESHIAVVPPLGMFAKFKIKYLLKTQFILDCIPHVAALKELLQGDVEPRLQPYAKHVIQSLDHFMNAAKAPAPIVSKPKLESYGGVYADDLYEVIKDIVYLLASSLVYLPL